MISVLEELKVEYSISGPFERFVELKENIFAEFKSQAQMDYIPARWVESLGDCFNQDV